MANKTVIEPPVTPRELEELNILGSEEQPCKTCRRRANIILGLSEGKTGVTVSHDLSVNKNTVTSVRKLFTMEEDGRVSRLRCAEHNLSKGQLLREDDPGRVLQRAPQADTPEVFLQRLYARMLANTPRRNRKIAEHINSKMKGGRLPTLSASDLEQLKNARRRPPLPPRSLEAFHRVLGHDPDHTLMWESAHHLRHIRVKRNEVVSSYDTNPKTIRSVWKRLLLSSDLRREGRNLWNGLIKRYHWNGEGIVVMAPATHYPNGILVAMFRIGAVKVKVNPEPKACSRCLRSIEFLQETEADRLAFLMAHNKSSVQTKVTERDLLSPAFDRIVSENKLGGRGKNKALTLLLAYPKLSRNASNVERTHGHPGLIVVWAKDLETWLERYKVLVLWALSNPNLISFVSEPGAGAESIERVAPKVVEGGLPYR